ncbi:hypothetical protein C8R46DRAFT_349334 [Mycena filopes]|nr:hypothetical protein C8R46DRAFT_349334 [Mycena filopes]
MSGLTHTSSHAALSCLLSTSCLRPYESSLQQRCELYLRERGTSLCSDEDFTTMTADALVQPRSLPELPTPEPAPEAAPAPRYPSNPPAYEESTSAWLAEDPYQTPLSSSPPPPSLTPDAALRRYADSAVPLRPQRAPTSFKRDSDAWSIRSVRSVNIRASITKLYRRYTIRSGAPVVVVDREHEPLAPPLLEPLPPPLSPLNLTLPHDDSGPASEWIDDEHEDENEDELARPSSGSNNTRVGTSPTPTLSTKGKAKGPHSPWPPSKASVVIRYHGEDEPQEQRPAPVPYEKRPSERRMEDKKHDEWRQRMIDRFCL